MDRFDSEVYAAVDFHWQEPKQIAERLRSRGIEAEMLSVIPALWRLQDSELLECKWKEVDTDRLRDRVGRRVREYRKVVGE